MKRKGLVCIHTAKSFADFIWYISTYEKETEWDLVVDPYIPYEDQKEYYLATGLFKEIYYLDNSIWDNKYILFLKYILYYVTGRRKKMARNIIARNVPEYDSYDTVVIFGDQQTMEGAIVLLSDEKDVVWLEDGAADYKDRSKKYQRISGSFFSDIGFFLLGRMGYASIGFKYILDHEKDCNKFSTFPERLSSRTFKSHKKLNDFSLTDMDMYNSLVNRIYKFNPEEIESIKEKVILFTTELFDFTEDADEEINKAVKYIEQRYKGKTIFVKKHPRDSADYNWEHPENVCYIDTNIPGEMILSALSFEKEIYIFPSSILMLYNEGRPVECLKFNSLLEKRGVPGGLLYGDAFPASLSLYNISKDSITEIQ